MPSSVSAAARFAVTVDLPTPPLPEPTQMMFFTAARAPGGGPSRRPSRCWRPLFSCWVSTSKPTFTSRTPSRRRTAVATPFWKCERIGQPGVVSDTTTSTRPSAGCSIERTIPRSTMLWRSSGSMTTLSASLICSCVGIASGFWQRAERQPARPRRTPPAEGGEILHCRAGYEARQLYPAPALHGRGEVTVAMPPARTLGARALPGMATGLNQRRDLGPDVLGGLRDAVLDALGRTVEVAGADVTRDALDRRLEVARVALHEALDLVAALTQTALELRAGPLDLTLELVARGRATTLGPLQALRELTLSRGARHVRANRLHDVVASDQRGADRDQHSALSLRRNRLDGELLRLHGVDDRVGSALGRGLRGRRGAARVGAGLLSRAGRGPATARSGGALGGGAALRRSALALAGRTAAARGRAGAGRVGTGAATSGAAGGGAAAGSAAAVLGSHCWRSLLRVRKPDLAVVAYPSASPWVWRVRRLLLRNLRTV